MATANEYNNAIAGSPRLKRRKNPEGEEEEDEEEGFRPERARASNEPEEDRGRRVRVGGSVVLISHIGQPWQRQPEPSTRPI